MFIRTLKGKRMRKDNRIPFNKIQNRFSYTFLNSEKLLREHKFIRALQRSTSFLQLSHYGISTMK